MLSLLNPYLMDELAAQREREARAHNRHRVVRPHRTWRGRLRTTWQATRRPGRRPGHRPVASH